MQVKLKIKNLDFDVKEKSAKNETYYTECIF